jgi:hypothetical protein
VSLNGRQLSADGLYEKTIYRCVPAETTEKRHDFLAPMAALRAAHDHDAECPSCERSFERGEGLAAGFRYAFPVRQVAEALVRAGRGESYREISSRLRTTMGRTRVRGRHPAKSASRGAQLVIDYLDAFGPLVAAEVSPKVWPAIIALDAKPVIVADHSGCCGSGKARLAWHPHPLAPLPPGLSRRPKVAHAAPKREIGRILTAVGYAHPGDANPRPILIRFAGGGDEVSWSEFLSALPGKPSWVVSDRDGAIANAVKAVFGKGVTAPVHYFCEQHIADNAAKWARFDGVTLPSDPLWPILERAQFGPQEWADFALAASALPSLSKWILDTSALMVEQWGKRKPLHPRSAGACEAVIRSTFGALSDRVPHFANADRLNTLLALVRAELDRVASVSAYSHLLREALGAVAGKANPDWSARRDPVGASSMAVLLADAQAAQAAAVVRRAAPKKAARYRARKQAYVAERVALGLPPAPRGRPRILRAQTSVAGKTVADFAWLLAEWHPTKNGTLAPDQVPAGGGERIWWVCAHGTDHEWQAQTRSRALRGTGCPFCAHKALSPSEALAVTHPQVAAQWHPERNGTKTPGDFTYGSHFEAWWQCPKIKSHLWRARIASRTSMLAGCPLCSRAVLKRGRVRADAVEASKSA